ncbi:MAG: NarK/NasA family nitrate transporter [Deltaproteobacteria bacterium]|nr:NarK/NasA family nitrate transporter [Deltaproteobacteria bacterium]
MWSDRKAVTAMLASTFAFLVCFACWTLNGVLVTWLVENQVFKLDKAQIGWLLGVPVLTGSVVRLPLGALTDRYGGRIVFTLLLLTAAVPMYAVSHADSYADFLLASFGFGLAGGGFAVGIAYTSVWFKQEHQGTALGIFGAGNAGAALTSIGGPQLLQSLTHGAEQVERWRLMPRIYAAALVVTAVLFYLATTTRRAEAASAKTIVQQLAPLRYLRVWRFGLYYFFVFGGFVALAQWLIPYYVSVYAMPVATAGLLASTFSLPSGVIRALGGWISDRFGARKTMYWILSVSVFALAALLFPRMEIVSPGEGVMSARAGVVSSVSQSEIVVQDQRYALITRSGKLPAETAEGVVVWPKSTSWQEPVVAVGEEVKKKQLLARGITNIFFQANVWIFTFLVMVIGVTTGIGKAAVYKHIPTYYPQNVGVVGGIVGVIGGLGGFFLPILFGTILKGTGLWTTCWLVLLVLCVICLVWMHAVIMREAQDRT